MQNSMEYEAKVLLSESEYKKLLNPFLGFNTPKFRSTKDF